MANTLTEVGEAEKQGLGLRASGDFREEAGLSHWACALSPRTSVGHSRGGIGV